MSRRRAPWELPVLAGAVAWLALPVLATGRRLGADHDWLTHHFHHRFARDALLHGILPTWSPWVSGGQPLAGHPEAPFPSPLLLPTLLLGEALGPKLGVVFFAALGALGTWLLARRAGLHAPGRTGAALAVVLSSWASWCVADGNYVELHWLLFPAVLAGLWRADRAGVLGAGALLALAVFDGNVAVLTMGVGLVVGLLLLPDGPGRAPRRLRPLRLLGAGLTAAVLAAGKLPPLLALLRRDARHITDYADAADVYYTASGLLRSLLQLHPDGGPYPLSRIAVGPLVALLAAAGVGLGGRRALPWLGLGLVGAWLAMGPSAPVDLFGLLWELPLLGSVRHPAKAYDFLVVLSVGLLAGLALDRLTARQPRATPLLAVAVVPVAVQLPALLSGSFPLAPLAETTPRPPFRQLEGLDLPRYSGRPLVAEALPAYLDNAGILDWKPNLLVETAARASARIDATGSLHPVPGHRGEAWLDHGEVLAVIPRHDGLDVELRTDGSDRLHLNQDADPCLVSSAGPVTDEDGLARVTLSRPATRVELRCRPPGLGLGLAVQLVGWLLLGGWWLRRRRAAPGSERPPSRTEAPAPG